MTQCLFTLARSTDPAGSHDAARRMVTSGARESQNQRVWWAVREHPNATYHEIAGHAGLQPIQAQRRCSYARCREPVMIEHHDLGGIAFMCIDHWNELCDLERDTPEFEAFRLKLGLDAQSAAASASA
ncbi:MAG: hypothetical protein ACREJC_04225 [Tepidisphaeraceae bacterium]